MGNSNKAKSLSKKLIKNASSNEFEKSDFFNKKTKEYMLLGISEVKYLSLLKTIETEKSREIVRSKMHVPIRKLKFAVAVSVLLIVALSIFLNKNLINAYTALVEGKVTFSYASKNQILVPNQQSNLDLQSNDIRVTTVDEAGRITSCKEDVFDFERKPLKRYYDCIIALV